VKPPSSLPISTIYLWKNIIEQALKKNGAPIGTTNIITGPTLKLINQWIKNPLVDDIIYFGSSDRGLNIGSKIFSAGKKPILELSGKDIVIIWEDADIEQATDSLLDCFLGSTQICMVPKMALIHEEIYSKFRSVFIEKVKKLRVGLPSDPETCLSPVSQVPQVYSFLEDALQKGANILCGGRRLNYKNDVDSEGIYIEPTVIELEENSNIFDVRCVKEEIFFPLLPLIKIGAASSQKTTKNKSILNKMIDIANKNEFGLRISIWCKSDHVNRKMIRRRLLVKGLGRKKKRKFFQVSFEPS
jgi:acyl-CoA reductase-like NAD-dependent aldehyde dehydrogenase